ncbi:hypothetical protein CHARACLAT_011447 [Characodon lateralis]|uniref:Uncharacterized protein n=1 Tax=Characodon lateralis TaxID=208331 RepID=A0ABU7E8V6_9TELE|nr:hypothetical protein [Characodon lateralis]
MKGLEADKGGKSGDKTVCLPTESLFNRDGFFLSTAEKLFKVLSCCAEEKKNPDMQPPPPECKIHPKSVRAIPDGQDILRPVI